jgi:lipopolysaccharide/colanic/teichoic acid biosynthesis glycosyltransferase
MKLDAEADGPQWAAAKKDDRCIPFGALLRKFRLDEIPQMINVLRGDMSFVGPRPERPEFYADLERAIPFYRERLLVQPGITGWAQVRYPYGASLDDAWRKHELDLYYMKHMSLVLDFFILLETVRTVIAGGARDVGAVVLGMQEIKKAVTPETVLAPASMQKGVTGLA